MTGPWEETKREPLNGPHSWPGGNLVAVWPVINIECFLAGRGGPAIQPHLASAPEIANSGWRDYGNRAGVARLARVFEASGLPATAALNSDLYTLFPEAVETVLTAGWEIMGHGINNSTGHAGMDRVHETAAVQQALDAISSATGSRPVGWLTPGFAVTRRTPSILASLGVRYTADATDDDVPYTLCTPAGRITVLPYSMETNDISLCVVARYTAPEYADALVDHVTALTREARPGRPLLVALGIHPFIAGQPGRAMYLQQALERIAGLPAVWFGTGTGIQQQLMNGTVAD